ncbi:MAG: PRD domain-containing protein, partial [Clostridiaceae bacterium]
MKEKNFTGKNIYDTVPEDTEEYKVALKIRDLISSTFSLEVPDSEVAYISIILNSAKEEKQGKVGIVVAAHGNSTATSIVNVAETLLGNSNICAVDMPLDVSPMDILEIVIEKIKYMDNGKGVLLLVDMGSLCNFESVIIERTGIQVKTLDMVSTPLTLEAVRRADILDMELKEIYNFLKSFRGYNNEIKENNLSNKVIVTVCSSGKGAAIKLKEIVERIILELTDENVNVIPAGVMNFDKKIQELQKKYTVLAVVGVKKP